MDTLDFTPATADLNFRISSSWIEAALFVTDSLNTVTHFADFVEHLVGGSGDDLFEMAHAWVELANSTGTIRGGLGVDTISYVNYSKYFRDGIYNGVGLAGTADVEILTVPPVRPKGDSGVSELFGEYGANSIDELIDIVKDHPGTYPSGSGTPLPLNPGTPTAVSTASGNLVIFPAGVAGTTSVKELSPVDLEKQGIQTGATYITQSGRIAASGPGAQILSAMSIAVSTSGEISENLPTGKSIAVIFQMPADMLGKNVAIMWWDAARGMWTELHGISTAGGNCIAYTHLTGTFALMAND
jgi:hypothetical protein